MMQFDKDDLLTIEHSLQRNINYYENRIENANPRDKRNIRQCECDIQMLESTLEKVREL